MYNEENWSIRKKHFKLTIAEGVTHEVPILNSFYKVRWCPYSRIQNQTYINKIQRKFYGHMFPLLSLPYQLSFPDSFGVLGLFSNLSQMQ